MTFATMFALPLLMLAQGYNLIVTQTNGEVTEIPTEEITTLTFEENEPEPPVVTQLATPRVTVSSQGSNTIVSWRSVDNASAYSYSIDGGEAETTTSTQVSIPTLSVGEHTVAVTAISDNEAYTDSETAVVSFTISSPISISTLEVKYNYILAEFESADKSSFYVGIMPKSNYVSDKEAIKYINNDTKVSQRKEVKGSGEVYFRSLSEKTDYIIFAYPKDATDKADKLDITTPADTYIPCN